VKSSMSELEQALEASRAGARAKKGASPPLVPKPESVGFEGDTLRNFEPKTTSERSRIPIPTPNQETRDAHLNMDGP
jgi:hypothetical protein